MKKLLLAFIIGLATMGTAFAADANKVSVRAINSFSKDFQGITNVEWKIKSGMNCATFVKDAVQTEVFYDNDGTKIATCKLAEFSDLPGNARKSFTEKYAGYNITQVISFEDSELFFYFMSIENSREKLILKVSNGRISVFKKM